MSHKQFQDTKHNANANSLDQTHISSRLLQNTSPIAIQFIRLQITKNG